MFLINILDINECTTNTDNCDSNATCDNTQGSFNCVCNNGFRGNGTHCDGNNNQSCQSLLSFPYLLFMLLEIRDVPSNPSFSSSLPTRTSILVHWQSPEYVGYSPIISYVLQQSDSTFTWATMYLFKINIP